MYSYLLFLFIFVCLFVRLTDYYRFERPFRSHFALSHLVIHYFRGFEPSVNGFESNF